jgi:cytochrome P450
MLPPGPSTPAAVQTLEWIARPTDLLRRSAARFGEPFTLRIRWADAPMVLVSDPAEIRRIHAEPPAVLRGGASSRVLEPFAGPSSILLTDGEEHLRARKLVLPPFHGERMEAYRAEVARLAAAEIDLWPAGVAVRTLPRMQSLTLDMILRVVLGAPDPRLREAIRAALDLTQSPARLAVLSLAPPGTPPWRRFDRAVARVDALLLAAIRERPPGGGAVLDELIAAGGTERELRDQVVTLLAAGHETTAGALAWACERLARRPEVQERLRAEGDDAYLDATVKEVLRTRPVLSITPRKAAVPYELGGYTLPAGTHVTPSIYLAHRRPELWPDPTSFRPERFLGARTPPGWLPFGGGIRRCAGAAFAGMELQEVLRALVARRRLVPDRPDPERMRRRGVTLSPSRGGRVVASPW